MSDDEQSVDGTPNYEKLRGMGFICWREIPQSDDEEKQKSKKKNKRKLDEPETEILPKKKKRKNKKKNKKKSNESHATSTLKLIEEKTGDGTTSNIDDDQNIDDSVTLELKKKVWADLHVAEDLIRSLIEQNFNEPTPIQKLSLPAAIRDRLDVIGAAETGSGKTLAFALPILTHMINMLKNDEISYGQLTCLILTPTRELAVQIKSHIELACRYTKFKTAVMVGGMSTQKQERLLRQNPEIIVATPGRFWELIEEGVEHLSDLTKIRFLAIDETDRMIEKGHFEELEKILRLLNEDHVQRQKFVFSATLMLKTLDEQEKKTEKKKKKDQDEKLAALVTAVGIQGKPKVIDLTKKIGTAESLTEARINCALEEKDLYLYYFLMLYPGRTLVFTNSIDCIKRLQSILTLLKRNPLPLHAQMEQKQRLNNLEKFSKSENGLLIATDVAARGLDIPNIKHIIHYQVPRSTELYIHRSGRTARAEREGLSVMFICPDELFLYRKIIKTLNRDEDLKSFPVDSNYLNILKRRVHLSAEISKLQHQVKKVANESNWYQKAAKELDIELDENISEVEKAKTAGSKEIQNKENRLRNELNILLKQPLKYSSTVILSHSYPLLFGDPDQLASKRKNDLTALEELKQRS